ncbi:MAG TPA: DUF5666 domain-containing protein [Acetobacteraceae bacterium]
MQAHHFARRHLWRAAAVAAWLVAAGAAQAQTPQPVRLRATIDAITADSISVTTRGGEKDTVALTPKTGVSAIAPVSLADIKSGSFIGTAAMPQSDGTQRALEVHVFPESMRGTGEGFRPFDLQPQSTMTNGTVGSVTGSSGRTLTISYKGGQQTVMVPPGTPVVTFEPGSRAMLVPGAHVIVFASKSADGTLTANRIAVGKNGLVPPM